LSGSITLFFLVTFAVAVAGMALFRFFPASTTETPAPAPAADTPIADIYDATLLKDDSLSTISIWGRLLQRFDWVEIMKRHISEAGMDWSVGRLTMFMLVAGTSTLGSMRFLSLIPGWMTLVMACAAAGAPYMVVMRRRGRRMRRVETQLPDALDTMSRALRAGHPIQATLDIVAKETRAPLGYELRKLADARALGMPLEGALQSLAERIPVSEVAEFTAALAMQNRTGGKLHEVLARLSENMRENEALKQEIEAISAHGKMTGLILSLMPVAIGVILSFTNPSQMAMLWGTPLGRNLVSLGLVLLVLAHFVIRRLVDIRI
jgi:tight adherence protein B